MFISPVQNDERSMLPRWNRQVVFLIDVAIAVCPVTGVNADERGGKAAQSSAHQIVLTQQFPPV
jgi:hypothetical protein